AVITRGAGGAVPPPAGCAAWGKAFSPHGPGRGRAHEARLEPPPRGSGSHATTTRRAGPAAAPSGRRMVAGGAGLFRGGGDSGAVSGGAAEGNGPWRSGKDSRAGGGARLSRVPCGAAASSPVVGRWPRWRDGPG